MCSFIKFCKITFSSKHHMELTKVGQLRRYSKNKVALLLAVLWNSPRDYPEQQVAPSMTKTCAHGAWSRKTKNTPPRTDRHIMQKMDAWCAFKAHTAYLQDNRMRNRILTLIDAIPDSFAAGIRYHCSCWKKYASPSKSSEDGQLHVQRIHLSEVREIFFKHVRLVVFEEHELRTLQSPLSDY